MPATGWTRHDAAVTVSRATHIPAAERRELLDMLGLLDTSQAIAPDPDLDVEVCLASINSDTLGQMEPSTGRMAKRYDPPSLGGRLCPPGLRALFDGQPPVPPAAEARPKPSKPKPPKKPKVGVGRGHGRDGNPINHGRPSGVPAHRRRGEEPCEACREARRVYDRDSKRKHYVPKPRRLTPCGTAAGRERHRRLKQKICDDCRVAYNESMRERRAAHAA